MQLLNTLRRTIDDPPSDATTDPRVLALRQVPPLVTDAAVLRANRLAVLCLVQELQLFNRMIEAYDAQLAELTRQHPDAELFRSFPGAGEALTPRLIAACGSDRERYDSAEDLQRLSGSAPVPVQSGKSCVVESGGPVPRISRKRATSTRGALQRQRECRSSHRSTRPCLATVRHGGHA